MLSRRLQPLLGHSGLGETGEPLDSPHCTARASERSSSLRASQSRRELAQREIIQPKADQILVGVRQP